MHIARITHIYPLGHTGHTTHVVAQNASIYKHLRLTHTSGGNTAPGCLCLRQRRKPSGRHTALPSRLCGFFLCAKHNRLINGILQGAVLVDVWNNNVIEVVSQNHGTLSLRLTADDDVFVF